MAHLFTRDNTATPPAWKLIQAIRDEVFVLPFDVLIRRPGGAGDARLGHACWYLLSPAGADVRVNGETLFLGTRLVRDRDEIVVEGERFFFSTERVAAVEPLPGQDPAIHCARCKLAAHPGAPVVRCPGCGAWYHQDGKYDCWTYDTKCSLCGFATALGGGFQWTPEQEGWS